MRRATASALAHALRSMEDANPSEVAIRDAYDVELSKIPDVTGIGWYTPPPKGVIVAIATPGNLARLDQPSFRLEVAWPRKDIRLTNESLLFTYSSRVHVPSGIIGDSSCTLYRGADAEIRSHLRAVWGVTLAIAEAAEVGMTFAALYARAQVLIERCGFRNEVYSVNDASLVNIGHTIPWSDTSPTQSDRAVLDSADADRIADLVGGKRRFLNANEDFVITENVAFTVEPRLSAAHAPMACFHVVVVFVDGMRHVVTEFDPVFDLFGMNDWLTV